MKTLVSLLVFLVLVSLSASCSASSTYIVQEQELQTLIDNNSYLLKNYQNYRHLLTESEKSLTTSKQALEQAKQESRMLQEELDKSKLDMVTILRDYNNLQESWNRYNKDQQRKIRTLKLERNILVIFCGGFLVNRLMHH